MPVMPQYRGSARLELGGGGGGLIASQISLSSSVKHTSQELCEIFKFWLFVQSKSVNNVCKLLQLLRKLATV